MLTENDLLHESNAQLSERLTQGFAIDAEALVGADYRGVSLGLPRLVERLTWKTFRKVFRRDPSSDGVVGHNVRMQQTGLDGPSLPEKKDGALIEFGPYRVGALPPGGTPFRCRAGLLLDYGARHPGWHPLSTVRDPIVALNEGSVEVLLGATYVALGPARLRTPSFFTLTREA